MVMGAPPGGGLSVAWVMESSAVSPLL
jgi:hypothetical protein